MVELAASYHAIGGAYGGHGKNFIGACALLKVDLVKCKREVLAAEKVKTAAKGSTR